MKNRRRRTRKCRGCKLFLKGWGKYCSRCYSIKSRFKVDPKDIHKIRLEQEGKCAICGSWPGERDLAVDHCHETGVIRGLLCTKCNMGLGYLKTRELLVKAVEYLDKTILVVHNIPEETQKVSRKRRPVDERIVEVLRNQSLSTLRSKARYLCNIMNISEDAALSRLRRYKPNITTSETKDLTNDSTCDTIVSIEEIN